MIPHSVTIDYASGNFEGCFYCRDEHRTYRWRGTLEEVKARIADHFEGCEFRVTLTAEAEKFC